MSNNTNEFVPKQQSITNDIRENLDKTSKDTRALYEVNPVKTDSDYAIREVNVLQNTLSADYRDWAKEHIRYDSLDEKQTRARLKQASDSYTMQMFMNCFTGFQEGITLGSLFSTMMTFRTMKVMNPDFEQDLSRFYLNYRDSLVPEFNRSYNSLNPAYRVAVAPLKLAFDKWDEDCLTKTSGKALDVSINKALDSNTLDNMVMTPRQVAILKVNFMEQYYADIRRVPKDTTSPTSDYMKLKQDYNIALTHLSNIANNSGFDMAVVAAEERYIVGLKMRDNPDYAVMFSDTVGLNGVRPVNNEDDGESWSGEFKTLDGHTYNVSEDIRQGSFVVREPVAQKEDYLIEIQRAAYGYVDIDRCVDRCSKDYGISPDKQILSDYKNDYRTRVISSLRDDLGMNHVEAAKYFDGIFDKAYEDYSQALDTKTPFKFKIDDIKGKDFPEGRVAAHFENEFNYSVDKDICSKLGISMPLYSKNDSQDDRLSKTKPFAKLLCDKYTNATGRPVDKPSVIWNNLRDNYVKSLSPEDFSNLLIRVNFNMEQGISNGHLARNETIKRSDLHNCDQYVMSQKRSAEAENICPSKPTTEDGFQKD